MDDIDIYCYSENEYSDMIPHRIKALALECIKKGRFPYSTKDKGISLCNENIISGKKIVSLQCIEFDLFSSLNQIPGEEELETKKWIYGAEAKLLGLKLKKETAANPDFSNKPLYIYTNGQVKINLNYTGGTDSLNEGMRCNNQAVYLLTQFTKESLAKIMSEKSLRKIISDYSEEVKKNCEAHAKRIFDNYTKKVYDPEYIKQLQISRQNMKDNLSKNNPNKNIGEQIKLFFSEGKGAYSDKEEKLCFLTVAKYYAQQNGGDLNLGVQTADAVLFKKVIESHDDLWVSDLFYNAKIFSDRLSHYGFSFEEVYTKQEAENVQKVRENSRHLPGVYSKAPMLQSIINEQKRKELLRTPYVKKKGYEPLRAER